MPVETVFAFLFNKVQDFILAGHSNRAICSARHLLVPREESAGGIIRSLMKTQDVGQVTRHLWPISSRYVIYINIFYTHTHKHNMLIY